VSAANYVGDHYLWNSGNFLFHAATMLGEIERFEPAIAEAAKAAVHGLTRDLDFLRLAAEPFARAPKKSIDYAVMERTKLAAVVPTDLGWSDIGSWSTVWHVLDHDSAGNATDGPVVMLDSRNNFVRSEESILTTVVGLDDIIVISTTDAVLVSARAKAEEVKSLVEQLKAHNYRTGVEHRRIYRPWGMEKNRPRTSGGSVTGRRIVSAGTRFTTGCCRRPMKPKILEAHLTSSLLSFLR
jgi:mannose-1-phosphate guanylyltransferase / mannose-6-phosphate isomerase